MKKMMNVICFGYNRHSNTMQLSLTCCTVDNEPPFSANQREINFCIEVCVVIDSRYLANPRANCNIFLYGETVWTLIEFGWVVIIIFHCDNY